MTQPQLRKLILAAWKNQDQIMRSLEGGDNPQTTEERIRVTERRRIFAAIYDALATGDTAVLQIYAG